MTDKKSEKPEITQYQKWVSECEAIEKYFKGEYTLEQLHEKGIRFIKPV